MSDAEDFATLFAREAARTVLEVGQMVKGRVIPVSYTHLTLPTIYSV